MNIETHTQWSRHLNKEMTCKVYGHAGKPALVFPTGLVVTMNSRTSSTSLRLCGSMSMRAKCVSSLWTILTL